MSDLNIAQIYAGNPSTTAASLDLLYLGKSPYGLLDDSAITFSDFEAQMLAYVKANVASVTREVYVSLLGNDSNPGTVIQPVRTIVHAQTLVSSPTLNNQWNIVIEPGFYSETNLTIFPFVGWYSNGGCIISDTSGSIILNSAAWAGLLGNASFTANGIEIWVATNLSLIYTSSFSTVATINLLNFTTFSGVTFRNTASVGDFFVINLLGNVSLDITSSGSTIDGIEFNAYDYSFSPGGSISILATDNQCEFYGANDRGSGTFSLASSSSGNISFSSFGGAQCNISSANASAGEIIINRDATTYETLPSSTGAVTNNFINDFIGGVTRIIDKESSNLLYVGLSAGNTDATVTGCTAVGYQAGLSLSGSSSSNNTLYGAKAGQNLSTSAQSNNAFGYLALGGYTSGCSANNAFGVVALFQLTNGASNTVMGDNVMSALTTGDTNSSFGANSGNGFDSLNGCSFFGYSAGPAAGTLSNSTAIGNGAKVGDSNACVIGDSITYMATGTLGCTLGNPTIPYSSMYLGSSSTSIMNMVPATMAAPRTYTVPDAGGAANFILSTTNTTAIVSINNQIFTSSGTYTPSTGIAFARARMWGGGAGGGGANGSSVASAAGGGGGSGAYAEIFITAAQLTSNPTITIGTGGAGGNSSGTGGSNGNDSSIKIGANGFTASGGSGGDGVTTASATAAAVIGGTGGVVSQNGSGLGIVLLPSNGQAGQPGYWFASGGFAFGGQGGSSANGGAQGSTLAFNGTSTGNSGISYGSGGSGAAASNIAAGAGAGNGQQGYILIEEYIAT